MGVSSSVCKDLLEKLKSLYPGVYQSTNACITVWAPRCPRARKIYIWTQLDYICIHVLTFLFLISMSRIERSHSLLCVGQFLTCEMLKLISEPFLISGARGSPSLLSPTHSFTNIESTCIKCYSQKIVDKTHPHSRNPLNRVVFLLAWRSCFLTIWVVSTNLWLPSLQQLKATWQQQCSDINPWVTCSCFSYLTVTFRLCVLLSGCRP